MRDLFIVAIHLLVSIAKLLRPGGVRTVAAESLLLNHQMQISNRSRHRAPNLTTLDRFALGLTSLFVNPRRIAKLAVILKPATLLRFPKALVDRKYRLLFSSSGIRCRPGPNGPSPALIAAIEYTGYRVLHELGARYPTSVRSVGGGAKNAAWTQLRTRLLHTRMLEVKHSEAAFGSAILAKQEFSTIQETTV